MTPWDPGTLRCELSLAKSGDRIIFQIPTLNQDYNKATGSWTIALNSPLSVSTPSLTIDGLTQQSMPGASTAHPVIELTPSSNTSSGAAVDGLRLLSGDNTVSGLVIDGFQGNGLVISGSSANGNLVTGNFIGTDVTGTIAQRNGGAGVILDGASNTIADNVISGNSGDGIDISTDGNFVQGNKIGTDVSGTKITDVNGNKLGNGIPGVGSGGAGVRFSGGTSNTISGNVISGNVNEGIFINPGVNQEMILGNFIGTNAAGTPLGNGLDGITLDQSAGNSIGGNIISFNGVNRNPSGGVISISDNGIKLFGADDNTIGGTTDNDRNVISRNGNDGVFISGGSKNNAVLGNYIGVGADGTTPLGNGFDGIRLNDASSNSIIGNVVSGNGINQDADGINLEASALNNIIAGNKIGTDVNGNKLGNSLHGIFLGNGSSNNTIGGAGAAGNVISGNSVDGIDILSDGNFVQGNKIGTNAAGTAALGNGIPGVGSGGAGVRFFGGTSNTISGNVISGNVNEGIFINPGVNQEMILGNFIGTNAAGTPLGNGLDGITLDQSAGNSIGGNIISFNGVNRDPSGGVISDSDNGIKLFGPGRTTTRSAERRTTIAT